MNNSFHIPDSFWVSLHWYNSKKNVEKPFKAKEIQRDYNETQKRSNVETELQKLEQQVITTTSKQTKELEKELESTSKELGNKIGELEKKWETTSKELGNKFEELEKKLESKLETTSKELDVKLEEILRLLKREWESSIQLEQIYIALNPDSR